MDVSPPRINRRSIAFMVALLVGTGSWAAPARAFTISRSKPARLDGRVFVDPSAVRIQTNTPTSKRSIGPGSTFRYPLTVANRTRSTVSFDLELRRVVGSSNVADVREDRGGAAGWASVDQPYFSLRSGETAHVLVTGQVPTNAPPGSHSFAVAVTQRPTGTPAGASGVTPIVRQLAVYIVEVPGDAIVSGELVRARIVSGSERPPADQFSHDLLFLGQRALDVEVGYRNTGQRLLVVSGRLTLRSLLGNQAGSFPIDSFVTYPDGSGYSSARLSGLPKLALLHGTITVTSEAGRKQHATGWFLVGPRLLPLMIIQAVLLLLVVVLALVRFRRYRRSRAANASLES